MSTTPKLDRLQSLVELIRAIQKNMKYNLGPDFSQAVSSLVAWFLAAEDHYDEDSLKIVVEEILAENGSMSYHALQTAIRRRYAQKINAVVQTPYKYTC